MAEGFEGVHRAVLAHHENSAIFTGRLDANDGQSHVGIGHTEIVESGILGDGLLRDGIRPIPEGGELA